MVKSIFLCGGSVLAVAASLCATQSFAATATAAAAADASQGALASELVVVAQKREQKIETVPVAITAFSAKEREILGIKTTQDLSNFTPGLSYFNSADRAYVRGIGRNTVNLAIASGVATYYNGVYYGANATIALAHDSLFIGNIEVDRGPQNTLHGSNSDGGTINYVSKKPTDSFYAEGRAGIGNYGLYYGEAVVSGPISDNWKFRIGGSYDRENGGFFKNLIGPPQGGSGPQGGNGQWQYFEAQIQGKIGDHLDMWTMVDTADYDTSFHTGAVFGNIATVAFPEGDLSPGSFFGLCAFPGANAAECSAANNGGQSVVPGSAVAAGPVTANQFPGNNPGNLNRHDFIQTTTGKNTQNDDIAAASQWTYHFPGMDLTYLLGFQQFYYNLYTEGATLDAGLTSYQINGAANAVLAGIGCHAVLGQPVPTPGCIAGAEAPLTIFPSNEGTIFIEKDQYFSHEFNLASTGAGPLQWMIGAYWYHEHYDQPVDLGCYPNQPQLGSPVAIAGGLNVPNPNRCEVNLEGVISYDDYAGFAHASYKFNDQWNIAGGFRYTDDHRYGYERNRIVVFDLTGATSNLTGALTPALDVTALPATGSPGTVGAAFFDPDGFAHRKLDFSWSAFTGDATINWTPDSSTLGYFRYARGYKAGGFNAGSLASVPTTKSEYVDDFELGIKKTIGATFLVNAALFYYNFQNDQQPFTVNQNGTNFSEIFNIPQSRIDGFELEGSWKPIDPITLNLQYSYLDAVVTNMQGTCVTDTTDPFAVIPGDKITGCAPVFNAAHTMVTAQPQNLTGARLPEAPPNKVSVNGQYAWKMDPGTLTFSATWIWKDKTYGSIFNRPLSLAPAYSQVDLRATWDDAKDRYTITAFVDNVTNAIGTDLAVEADTGHDPTDGLVSGRGLTYPLTFGAELQVRFR